MSPCQHHVIAPRSAAEIDDLKATVADLKEEYSLDKQKEANKIALKAIDEVQGKTEQLLTRTHELLDDIEAFQSMTSALTVSWPHRKVLWSHIFELQGEEAPGVEPNPSSIENMNLPACRATTYEDSKAAREGAVFEDEVYDFWSRTWKQLSFVLCSNPGTTTAIMFDPTTAVMQLQGSRYYIVDGGKKWMVDQRQHGADVFGWSYSKSFVKLNMRGTLKNASPKWNSMVRRRKWRYYPAGVPERHTQSSSKAPSSQCQQRENKS